MTNKIIIASDTHRNLHAIEAVTRFAKKNGIETIFDCGDLHGEIRGYDGINLHAVYWSRADGAMNRKVFEEEIRSINGTMHGNGHSFIYKDMAIFMQHNLAGYEKIIPEKALSEAEKTLETLASGKDLTKLILFGHTHKFHYLNDGVAIAINPGSLGMEGGFAIFDSGEKSVEYLVNEKSVLKFDSTSEYKRIRNLQTNPLAFIAKLSSGNESIIFDGKRSKESPLINVYGRFAVDKGNLAYATSEVYGKDSHGIRDKTSSFVILNDVPGPKFKDKYIDQLRFEKGSLKYTVYGQEKKESYFVDSKGNHRKK